MPLHEHKQCPRCKQAFECKVGDVGNCQCNGIKLTVEERNFIEVHYSDCLCGNCLKDLKSKHVFFKEKFLRNN